MTAPTPRYDVRDLIIAVAIVLVACAAAYGLGLEHGRDSGSAECQAEIDMLGGR